MPPITTQLKALRESAAPRISIRTMAQQLGMPASSYAAYEDPAKFKKPILPLNLAQRIADILVDHGVERRAVLALAGVTGELSEAARSGQQSTADEWLLVAGAVQAGVWKFPTTLSRRLAIPDFRSAITRATEQNPVTLTTGFRDERSAALLMLAFTRTDPPPSFAYGLGAKAARRANAVEGFLWNEYNRVSAECDGTGVFRVGIIITYMTKADLEQEIDVAREAGESEKSDARTKL